MRKIVVLGIGVAVAMVLAAGASAGVAYFADPYDTIQVSQGTTLGTAATIEARILFSSNLDRTGYIFCEWTDSYEDKTLNGGGGSPGTLHGYFFNLAGVYPTPVITMDTWHHLAIVLDNSAVRAYLDGTQVASQPAAGDIGDSSGLPYIGAIHRDYFPQESFGGYLDWLRVSDIARYPGGTSFTPPSGQPASDANTQLLLYFDEPPGSSTAQDQSSYHRNGFLGEGFAEATSPEFTSDVAQGAVPSLGLAGLVALGLALAAVGALALALRRG